MYWSALQRTATHTDAHCNTHTGLELLGPTLLGISTIDRKMPRVLRSGSFRSVLLSLTAAAPLESQEGKGADHFQELMCGLCGGEVWAQINGMVNVADTCVHHCHRGVRGVAT